MNNVKDKTKENVALIVFFLFLITSLFLGDGKQPFVDAWWALGILTMYGIRYYQRGGLDFPPLPRLAGFAWTALIVYSIILIPFSDSAGYSISAIIRLLEGCLIYMMFVALSRDSRSHELTDSGNHAVELFTKGLLLAGAVATLASFVFLFFPSLARLLPPMNLLYANYGHNHLADLLLFVFPIAIGLVEKKRGTASVGLLAFFTIGMILTFARGAWILLVVYLFFVVVRSKNATMKRAGLFVVSAIIAAFLAVSLVSVSALAQSTGLVGQLVRQAQKPTFFEDNRREYWRQAAEAIKERPFFGGGPGTFYLQSRRLQSAPNSWSWFAHSLPLQIAVETGLVGAGMFFFLIFILFQKAKKDNALLWGSGLVLAYASYEFTLDYASVWIPLCATLGALACHEEHKRNKRQTMMVSGALTILGAFYVLSLGSMAATVVNNKKLAFYLAPHDAKAARETEGQEKAARFFHQKNPEVLSWIASTGSDESIKQKAMETLAATDPWGDAGITAARYLLERKFFERAARMIIAKQGRVADNKQRKELSGMMIDLGDEYYMAGNFSEAGKWYKQAQEADAWALHKHKPPFLYGATTPGREIDFYSALRGVPGYFFGSWRSAYGSGWLSALHEAPPVNRGALLSNVAGIINIAPWSANTVWKSAVSLLLRQSKEAENSGTLLEATRIALMVRDVWVELSKTKSSLDRGSHSEASGVLMRLGGLVAQQDLVLAAEAQSAAIMMTPWIGSRYKAWYDDVEVKKISAGELVAYLDKTTGVTLWDFSSQTRAELLVIQKLLTEGKALDAGRYAAKTRNPKQTDYYERKNLAVMLQKKADERIEQKDYVSAEKLIAAMSYVLPDYYWVRAQPGNYFISIGENEKARIAYQECLNDFVDRHADCRGALESLDSGKPNRQRYQQVSQIIQGKTRWQDF
ncbi:O-antigen ligase family protein [Candidatus Gottesmanbacteria bacterium]|nr:O-antigen ligase family protein [Candidatus Gottesmanbacteria bacterium]